MEIIYVAMPISVEQKRAYNRQGFRVVDVRFAPEGYEPPVAAEEPQKRPRRRAKVEE